MGMKELEDALTLIKENPDDSFFAGPKSEELISKAENALGLFFPPTYRRFVKELGAGNIAGQEFYGVTTDNFDSASVPNGVWFTLHARKNYSFPDDLIIVFSLDDGSYIALNAHKEHSDRECEVVLWTAPDEDTEVLYDDFGFFLLERITDALNE